MGQSAPFPNTQAHDTAPETAYNTAIVTGADKADEALRDLVIAHLTAYPYGINDHHPRNRH